MHLKRHAATDAIVLVALETGRQAHRLVVVSVGGADTSTTVAGLREVLAELAARGNLTVASHSVESVAVDAAGTEALGARATGTVFSTLSALSTDVAVASGTVVDALVAEDVADAALADTVHGESTSRASGDASGTNKTEALNAGSALSRRGTTGVAGIGAVVADTIDGHSLRIGAAGAEHLAGTSLAVGVAGDTGTGGFIGELVGVAGVLAEGAAAVEAGGTVDAVVALTHTAVAFRVAWLAHAVKSEEVLGAVLHAHTLVTVATHATGAVLGVSVAGLAGRVTSLALIDGGLVEASGAVEGADAANHDVGTLVVAGTVVEHLVLRAAGAGGGAAYAGSAVERAVLAGVVDCVGAHWAVLEALKVEQVAAAALTGQTLAGVLRAGGAGRVACHTAVVLSGGD